MTSSEDYQITERWRGVEQPLDGSAKILDIWNAWGTVQSEVPSFLSTAHLALFLILKHSRKQVFLT